MKPQTLCAGTGELVAVEVHGRHQFSANTRAPAGRIIARHRLLVARGWAVIHVPGYMWGALDDAVRGAWLLQARRHLCCFNVGSPVASACAVMSRE